MSALSERVAAVLGDPVETDAWTALMRLFEVDREAFYLLACDSSSFDTISKGREIAILADRVRTAVAESYDIELNEDGAVLVSYSGVRTPIPIGIASQVKQFLRVVDGKTTAHRSGTDYEGGEISESEMRFKLGDPRDWPAPTAKLEARRDTKPFVLRVFEDDLAHLVKQPAYVTYGLLNSARTTVLAPTDVRRGLKRGDGACEDVDEGWAFCASPRRAFDTEGNVIPPPIGMVFAVFADQEGYVFDWDWVEEDPCEPGSPIDAAMRFGDPVQLGRDAILDIPEGLTPGTFDPSEACYSERGDCIFCYISDKFSYAQRINRDLTVFREFGSDSVTGFKVKNVTRILHEDKSIILPDAPDLTVSVQGALLATLKGQKDTMVDVYEVIIAAWRTAPELPKVRVPKARLMAPEMKQPVA